MAFEKIDSDKDYTPKPMIQGNWKCNGCGKEITELPFEPSEDRPIHCKDCWREQRSKREYSPRPMIQGNWKCSECGKEITELPFEPSQDRPIHCKDCWREKRSNRF